MSACLSRPPSLLLSSVLYTHAALAPFYDGVRSSVSMFEASWFKTVLLQCVLFLSAVSEMK